MISSFKCLKTLIILSKYPCPVDSATFVFSQVSKSLYFLSSMVSACPRYLVILDHRLIFLDETLCRISVAFICTSLGGGGLGIQRSITDLYPGQILVGIREKQGVLPTLTPPT